MKSILLVFLFLFGIFGRAQNFTIIPLGVKGGADESNLSSYLISDDGKEEYLSLDAGSLYSGIRVYLNTIQSNQDASSFLQNNIKGYYISHPHFDHSSGLIINSPEDISGKKIYGPKITIDAFQKHVFVWDTWANFGNDGEKPILNKFIYQTLEYGKAINVDNTQLSIKTFPLSHVGEEKSSAVLVKNSKSAYFLYLGDTGADRIENSDALKNLWSDIAYMIKSHSLKGIAIECSYTNSQPNNLLFGHLKPELLMEEISVLENLVGVENLKKVTFIITHIKDKKGVKEKIIEELQPLITKYKVIFAEQGQVIKL